MKAKNMIIKVVILIIILVFLLNPSFNPLFSSSTKAAVQTQLKDTFGALVGGTPRSLLSAPRITTLLAMIVGIWLLATIINFILRRIKGKRKHTTTVIALLVSVIKYVAVLAGIIWGLNILGVNITAIFASVGVLSLIIGFGAQSLIEDMITGIFIIFENNFGVGDYIVLDDFRGKVTRIGIRTTCIEDEGGNLKIVNNSDIRNFQNRSENLSLVVCDVGVSYGADVRSIEKVIVPALDAIYENNKDIFEDVPVYKGVESLGTSSVVLRITTHVKEENFFIARRRLNREIKILFDENNIEIPFTQVVLHQASKD